VFDITFLEGQDFELVVKELAVVDFHSNMVSSYVVKRPYSWHKVPAFKPGMYQAIDHGCNWNFGDVYIQNWKLCYIARRHLPLQSIAWGLRKHNLLVVSWTVQLFMSLS
jgi:hypothetical protein